MPKFQTALGFDFGTQSIGVSIGQAITGTAQPLSPLKAKDGIPNWDQLAQVIKEWQPDGCVVGLPLNMDGTEQPLTARARKFAGRLEGRFGVQVQLMDERLTTVEARSNAFEQRGYKGLDKGRIDSEAACLILESWFTSQVS